MSTLGIRRRLKTGIKRVLGMDEDPAARPSPRPPAAPSPAVAPALRFESPPIVEPPVAAPKPAPEPAPEPASAEPPAAAAPGNESPTAPSAAADDVVGAAITYAAVQELLDDMVRPALQGDGGDIALVKVEENSIYVKLVGACSSCPSSVMTMRQGIELLLREEFPAMNELVNVDEQPLPAEAS